jgi:hypothetical protein
MDHQSYTAITEGLRQQMAERLSIRARSFPHAVRKAGRLLPANARAAARDLIAAEPRLRHPKFATRTDPNAIHTAANTFSAALRRHKPGTRRARQRSLLAAELGFRALVIIVAGMMFVQWQMPV